MKIFDIEFQGSPEKSEAEKQQILWHEQAWVEQRFKSLYEKSPVLAKLWTRFQESSLYVEKESRAPGPLQSAAMNYKHTTEHPKPEFGIGFGPGTAIISGIYHFVKGGATFEVLKKKYGLK